MAPSLVIYSVVDPVNSNRKRDSAKLLNPFLLLLMGRSYPLRETHDRRRTRRSETDTLESFKTLRRHLRTVLYPMTFIGNARTIQFNLDLKALKKIFLLPQ
jgi:hypothetical protein